MHRTLPLLKLLCFGSLVISFCLFQTPQAHGEDEKEIFTFDFEPEHVGPKPPYKKRQKVEAPKVEGKTRDPYCAECAGKSHAKRNLEELQNIAAPASENSAETAPEHRSITNASNKLNSRKGRKRIAPILPAEENEQPTPGSPADAGVWSQFPEIAAYSNSSQVNASIKFAKAKKLWKSTGNCYKFVKNAIYYAGKLTRKRLGGTPVFPEVPSAAPRREGQNAIKNLKAEGFINLMERPDTKDLIKNPASAPKGSILVYMGGGNGGHIEIKTDFGSKGSYISDFASPKSILQNDLAGKSSAGYRLVAVMVQPMPRSTQDTAQTLNKMLPLASMMESK